MKLSTELQVLGTIALDVKKFKDLKNYGFKLEDFDSAEAKATFQSIEQAFNNKLDEVPTHYYEQHLSEEKVSELEYNLAMVDVAEKNYKGHLADLFLNKQDKMLGRVLNRYIESITTEKNAEKKNNLYDEMQIEINKIRSRFAENSEETLGQIAAKTYTKEMLALKPISSGYDFIDKYTLGFWRGLTHILAAESGNGKTTLTRNLIVRMALDKKYGGQGQRVLFVSLEMKKEVIASQFFAMLKNEPMFDWLYFNVQEKDLEAKRSEAEKLATAVPNLFIDDTSYSPEKLANKIRMCKGQYDIIFIDYFQHLDVEDGNQGSAFNSASRMITKATKETDCAVVLLSQITTDSGKKAKTEKEHQEGKLRFAKQLLNDACFELIVYRDEVDEDIPDYENDENKINLFIRKNRNGDQDVHTKLDYVPNKGIIGEWNGIEINETEQEYLNRQMWKQGEKPLFLAQLGYNCSHFTRPELQLFGFNIPETVFNNDDLDIGIREEIISDPILRPFLTVPYEEIIFGSLRETNEEKTANTDEFEFNTEELFGNPEEDATTEDPENVNDFLSQFM